jgi:hypothetical protein
MGLTHLTPEHDDMRTTTLFSIYIYILLTDLFTSDNSFHSCYDE